MLSLTTTGKFTPRPLPPPLSSGYQISQQGNEYWNSLATSSDQNNNWKIDYNNNNNVLMDIGGKCGYDVYTPLPLQTGRLGSFHCVRALTLNRPTMSCISAPMATSRNLAGYAGAIRSNTTSRARLTMDYQTPSTMRTQKTPPSPSSQIGRAHV